MVKPYSDDLRERVVGFALAGGTVRQAAALFGIGVSSAVKWSQRQRATGSFSPKPMGGSRGMRWRRAGPMPWCASPSMRRRREIGPPDQFLILLRAGLPEARHQQAREGTQTCPYLLGGLGVERPNRVWCADITYLPMRKGFLYPVAVMDWFARKVLAWRISNIEPLTCH